MDDSTPAVSWPTKPLALIVTGPGSLITLAAGSALDALLIPGLPVIIPDMVRFEVVCDLDKPEAREVADWIRANEPTRVRIASTEVFEEFEVLRSVNPSTKTKARGEQAAAEVLARGLENAELGAILVFEDGMVRKQNLLVPLPDRVAVTSTSELLFAFKAMESSRHDDIPPTGTYNTTPSLRLKALLEAGELLRLIGEQSYVHWEVLHGLVSIDVQMRARELLTHFPHPGEVLDAVRGEYPINKWLAIDPSMEDMGRWLNPGVQYREREPGEDDF
jgi:hypothetical protein